jgi:hypothetical protein
MHLCGGIDRHSNISVVALLDEDERLVYRKRLPNEVGAVLAALAPYREAVIGLVVESTYNWYWLVDALKEAGYPMHLAKRPRPGGLLWTSWTLVGHRRCSGVHRNQGPGAHAHRQGPTALIQKG